MSLPEHVQEQRNALVEEVIKDIEAGQQLFWDSGHFGRPAHNAALDAQYRIAGIGGNNLCRLLHFWRRCAILNFGYIVKQCRI